MPVTGIECGNEKWEWGLRLKADPARYFTTEAELNHSKASPAND